MPLCSLCLSACAIHPGCSPEARLLSCLLHASVQAELKEKLAKMYDVRDPQNVFVFGFRTQVRPPPMSRWCDVKTSRLVMPRRPACC